ncbi:MAG TPA: DUF2285 domain-containing protein [Asticcacaulis sp.]|nr:DUF2285 domain-containing protein [Asticcacaulis sp.]
MVAVDAERVPPGHSDAFNIAAFPGRIDILAEPGACPTEWALFSHGDLAFVLKVVSGSLVHGPVRLQFRLGGLADLEARLLTLRRLAGIHRLGRYPLALFPPEPAARKWAFALQVYDGEQAGASQRDIARVLFGATRVEAEWRGVSDSLRQRLRRALSLARRLVGGGFRDLLA